MNDPSHEEGFLLVENESGHWCDRAKFFAKEEDANSDARRIIKERCNQVPRSTNTSPIYVIPVTRFSHG